MLEVIATEPVDHGKMLVDRLEVLDGDGQGLMRVHAGARALVMLCQLVEHHLKFSPRRWRVISIILCKAIKKLFKISY